MSEMIPISALIREASEETPSMDENVIAGKVFDAIDPDDHALYLQKLIRDRVPSEIGLQRNAVFQMARRAGEAKPVYGGAREMEPAVVIDFDERPTLSVQRDPRIDKIREAFYSQPVRTESGNKRMRDLTAADCFFAAQVRADKAAANARMASEFRAYGDLIEQAGVVTLGDIAYAEIDEARRAISA